LEIFQLKLLTKSKVKSLIIWMHLKKINTADTPAPYSPVLLKEWLPNAEDVVKSIKKVLYK